MSDKQKNALCRPRLRQSWVRVAWACISHVILAFSICRFCCVGLAADKNEVQAGASDAPRCRILGKSAPDANGKRVCAYEITEHFSETNLHSLMEGTFYAERAFVTLEGLECKTIQVNLYRNAKDRMSGNPPLAIATGGVEPPTEPKVTINDKALAGLRSATRADKPGEGSVEKSASRDKEPDSKATTQKSKDQKRPSAPVSKGPNVVSTTHRPKGQKMPKALVSIGYPKKVEAKYAGYYKKVPWGALGQMPVPGYEWQITFKEVGGKAGFKLRTSTYEIRALDGKEKTFLWYKGIEVKAGGSTSVRFILEKTDDTKGCLYMREWYGSDDSGNKINIVEKVRLEK